MAFRNFMFAADDKKMIFKPKNPSNDCGVGSTSSLINKENLVVNVEPLRSANSDHLVQNSANQKESPVREQAMVVASRSVARILKDQNCRTRGSTKALAKAGSSSYVTIYDDDAESSPKAFELKTPLDCHLLISNITPPVWKDHPDNQMAKELLDLHDRYYARQI
nr:hypothetical protein [Tanacetum cinerariifolium]